MQARTEADMTAALVAHPVWRRASAGLREELIRRLVTAKNHFQSFDSDHAFEIVVGMTHLFDVLHQNILPIDGNRETSTPDKLWLIAETFRKLGSNGIRETLPQAGTLDAGTTDFALTNCLMCLEAAVCIDHYRVDALEQMAWALALRARPSDADAARRVVGEAARLIPALATTAFHTVGHFDEVQRQDTATLREGLRIIQGEMAKLEVQEEGDSLDDDSDDDLDDDDVFDDDDFDDIEDYEDAEAPSRPQLPEVEAALRELANAANGFDAVAFGLVADRVRTTILTRPEQFAEVIQSGTPVRRWVWGAISNAAGDLVESGEFHVYRGVLNPMGPGEGLVRIFDAAADEMVRLRAAEPEFVRRQKANLRKNIKDIG